jgi:hypothetical protein
MLALQKEIMELNEEEVQALQSILHKATNEEKTKHWGPLRVADPFSEAMLNHRPKQFGSEWICTCTHHGARYVSENHVLLTHIKPIMERAATHKIREILERGGLDLDVIIQSDKIFGEN